MKQRFNYIDLKAVSQELESQVVDYRLQNIYDLTSSSHLFLLKFAIPESKKHVIVDPGFRIHLTEYARQSTPSPSGFVTKLRKHLKTRRLTRIDVGRENRILSMSFNNTFFLVIEFFAGGNMILLDSTYKILSLQRVVSATEKQARCAVNEVYPLDKYLMGSFETESEVPTTQVIPEFTPALVQSWLSSSGGKKDKPALARVLYMNNPAIGGAFVEQCLAKYGVDGKSKNLTELSENQETLNAIIEALSEARTLTDLMLNQKLIPGCVIGERNPKFEGAPGASQVVLKPDESVDINSVEYLYTDFLPVLREEDQQDVTGTGTEPTKRMVYTASFNQAIDIYFSSMEATRASIRLNNQESQAAKRLLAAQDEKEKRVKGLESVQQVNNEKGHALLAYANRVEETMDAVRGLVHQGMDWTDIGNLIKLEQKRRNAMAQMIQLPMDLAKNKMTVKVPVTSGATHGHDESDSDSEDESDSDSQDEGDSDSDNEQNKTKTKNQTKYLNIEVDLDLSVYANARNYFDVKKTAAAKQERTVQQADQAYKSAEKKIKRDLQRALDKNASTNQQMHAIREPLWFEKFYWFVTSDGFLCLGGRDVVQNDLLLRKYFTGRDLLVHADVAGSPIVVVKNHHHEQPPTKIIPPSSLIQAGIFCTAASQAWEQKMAVSPWWATREQIPKVSDSGDVVTSEFLVVNGDKNHLPPCQLDMGLGFMWLLPEEEEEEPLPETVTTKEADSDEEFPDTAFDSDEEFPDVGLDDGHEFEEDKEAGLQEEPEEVKVEDEEAEEVKVEDEEAEEVKVEDEEAEEVKVEDEEAEQVKVEDEEPEEAKPESEEPEVEAKAEGEEEPKDETKAETAKSHVLDIEKELESLKLGGGKEKATGQKPPKTRKKNKKAKQEEIAPSSVPKKQKGKAKLSKQEAEEKKKAADKQRKERQQKTKEMQQKKIREELEQEYQGEQDFEFRRLVGRVKSKEQVRGMMQAVPVFGTWSSMQKLKFKVKVQAGVVKKGKAVKDVIHALGNAKTDASETDPDFAWPSELAAIRNLKEQEILQCMSVSRVRLSLSNNGKKR